MQQSEAVIRALIAQKIERRTLSKPLRDLDSLDFVELALSVEERFQINFRENDIKGVKDIEEFVRRVQIKLGDIYDR
ncbi:MAG: hypothetical protein A3F09_00420 [Chlamydiae bacterium RIFCSPHIGHO2_12_FULL_49_11]|nr:MAG: hypothetical protein A3F09_00420 [Chlamydiae bacterium RIFCSPHIGHO2_12_FULL_49_11]